MPVHHLALLRVAKGGRSLDVAAVDEHGQVVWSSRLRLEGGAHDVDHQAAVIERLAARLTPIMRIGARRLLVGGDELTPELLGRALYEAVGEFLGGQPNPSPGPTYHTRLAEIALRRITEGGS